MALETQSFGSFLSAMSLVEVDYEPNDPGCPNDRASDGPCENRRECFVARSM